MQHRIRRRSIVDAVAQRRSRRRDGLGAAGGLLRQPIQRPLATRADHARAMDAGVWPMTYDIAMGVRRNEPQLRERIEQILASRKPQIAAILRQFHVPELPITAAAAASRR